MKFYYIVACSAAWNISLFAQPAASSSPAPRLMSPLYRPSSSFTPSRSSNYLRKVLDARDIRN